MTSNQALLEWVAEVAEKTRPETLAWCDGSEAEIRSLTKAMLKTGILIELNQEKYQGCYLHRSDPNDVARTEHLTFICTKNKDDAGPTNNWMSLTEVKEKVWRLFEECMKGRTMYVIPYLLGPVGSPFSQVGVQVTDSPYVVANMRIMTRMGKVALDSLGGSRNFVRGIHSLGDLSPEHRYICHLPEEMLILSIGSGYGGNALLSKKNHSLRIAGVMARDGGWLAEHMLIIGVEDPGGRITYITGAFPSASGKTNLAMLKPPDSHKDWKVWTVGDDIAWMRIGPNGCFWAINPEAGFFGVAPGTSTATNPNAMETIRRNTIFSNVALTLEGTPWWEGMDGPPPSVAIDWQGKKYEAGKGLAAHPNSRFTAPISQCPSISPKWDDPNGVPISAILFGTRRAKLAPLIYESLGWGHGVFVGATMGAETTTAAIGVVGVVRRDPMAMLPFCGYNMADYIRHWLRMGSLVKNPPKIFHVNWFRKGKDGKYLWPGFGENIRVLKWIIDRVHGRGESIETPIGYVPSKRALDLEGVNLSDEAVEDLLRVERDFWLEELDLIAEFFKKFGDRLPDEMWKQHSQMKSRLTKGS